MDENGAAEGDFVWVVKDNQANTRQPIEQLFAPERPRPGFGCPPLDFRSEKTTEKQAGRIEERTLTTSSLSNNYLDWPHVNQVFKLERRVTHIATGIIDTDIQ